MNDSSPLENNLALLSEYNPMLADILRDYQPIGRAQVFQTPGGQFSLRLVHNNHEHLIHSSREPKTEAQRWVDNLDLPSMHNLMVFGCGLFYHIYSLLEKHHPTLANIVIVEKEMDVLYQAFSCMDLSAFLLSKSTHFLIDPSPRQIRTFMNDFLTPFVLNGLQIVEHPASVDVHPEFYHPARVVIEESFESGKVMLRTKEQLGSMIQENIIRNVPNLLANPSASALQGLLRDVPAFVVGAGPSLDWNIDQLAKVGESGIIIASDTVFHQLRERGIEPHIIVSTDPTPLNVRHFEPIQALKECILAFSPSVQANIVNRFEEGTKVSLPLPGSKFLHALRGVLGDQNYLATGINVAQTCYNLARFLGCNPLVLVGLDLSFSIEGGYTHASGSAYRRSIRIGKTPGKMAVELIPEKEGDPIEWEEFTPIVIKGNLDKDVATNKFWLAYLRSLEEEIAKTGARVINCTEGGAKIEGAEVDTLSNAIQTFCRNDAMPRSTLQMAVGFFFGMNQDEGIATLRDAENILKTALEKSEEGIGLVDELKTMRDCEETTQDIYRAQVDTISAIHEELIQNHTIYAVLDEAADRVLSPFLRMDNRPLSEELTPENIDLHIQRYSRYFSGMKQLCETFSKIVKETLDGMDTPMFDGF